METPIELELVGKKEDMYALKYPGLQIPIHVNFELLEKFRNSPDYIVRESGNVDHHPEETWIELKQSQGFRA
ncbi:MULTISPECIES: hypothetical protein [unclassified Leeuwenhoekiella]|uniref:hypothetical protein n=1 Tax=unclassified Leeuwenhoekiella TaxID=2615029 RepID=UPI000C6B6133|nr:MULTISPECIES: hypothetical protein [unclassified Leeuwenhoekiella]MAW96598.1 hypothetical protein [Leeuwenhoekiella sp.]MBA81486.1 hypothetical protein [Leeuwenhoekiella sp.]